MNAETGTKQWAPITLLALQILVSSPDLWKPFANELTEAGYDSLSIATTDTFSLFA